jgi:Fe-S cluster assembly iron-binding protein IscA
VGAYNDLVFESATINYAVDTRTGLPFLANTYITYDVEDIPENIPQSIIPNDNVNIVTDDEAVNTLNNLDIKLNETQEELINKLNQAQDALKDLPKFDANN